MRQGDKQLVYFANFVAIKDEYGEESAHFVAPRYEERLMIVPLTDIADITKYGVDFDITRRIVDDSNVLGNMRLGAALWLEKPLANEDGYFDATPDFTVITPIKAFGKVKQCDIRETVN